MNRLYYLALIYLNVFGAAFAQSKYIATIDLTKTKDDKVPVELMVPEIESDSVEYHMAKIVPGTYSISDFGRFVVDFKAVDANGDALEVKHVSTNRWTIQSAQRLHKITYWIEDSFDDFEGYGSNRLFEPGGMSIEAEKDVFVLNTFGFVGYIDGQKFLPYDLVIEHKKEIKGATSLKKIQSTETRDTYRAENFNFLADAPLLYCEPDITTKTIAGAEVLVSIYSPNKVLSSQDVMENIDDLMEAQAQYLGGTLPVDRYAYLIYLFENETISGAFGALEHSYSSLYTLPEMDPERISQTVKDVAAHEFFHIVTPLNIHSEEIHHFNYIEPEMSQHLWLYEGVTEYASQHVQVKYGLYELEDFLTEMRNKMNQQDQYNVQVPYTEFSENILTPENEAKYGDVYSGGALIAMCLDLTIIKSTNAEKDLQSILRELSKQYGPNKAFKDEELFDEIEKLTNGTVRSFLDEHVAGVSPLPFAEVLGWAGIAYEPSNNEMVITAGRFIPSVNEEKEIYVADNSSMNAFGYELGLKNDDVLVSWDGSPVSLETYAQVFENYYTYAQEGEKIKVVVRRKVKGKEKEVKLKAKAMVVKSPQKHSLKVDEDASSEQLELREIWLGSDATKS